MRLNNIGYLLKEGFKGIFLHGFMSFAAVCVTVACLVIVGSFSILAYNLDLMVEDLNQTSEILVYVDADLPDAEARSIGTQINLLEGYEMVDEKAGLGMPEQMPMELIDQETGEVTKV